MGGYEEEGVCVWEWREGWVGGGRGVCMGGFEECVCGSVVCGNVVYVGVRGCVNGEGIGIQNMFHY